MKRLRRSVSLMFLVAVTGAFAMPELRAQNSSDWLRVEGDAKAVHLDVRDTTVNDVLAALADSFDVSFRSAVALNDQRDGTYRGSLRQVIARVLDGYDYAIKQEQSKLDVIVFEKVGEHAVAAPQQHPVSRHREREARVSRER